VYIARAIDDRPPTEIATSHHLMTRALHAAGFASIDPVLEFQYDGATEASPVDAKMPRLRVEADLERLRRSDAVLADMSIPGWVYVGCICELVYAHLWRVPSVVITGDSALGTRMWLRYHATAIVPTLDAGVRTLRSLFRPGPPTSRASAVPVDASRNIPPLG
jgi:hypothetical protein